MTQAQRMEAAKLATYERIKDKLEDFEQFNDFSWGSLEEVNGQEMWVMVQIVAKKTFDPDEAAAEWELKKKLRGEKEAKKKASKQEKKN